jgi:tetratricopeptide (TPR) repeat protein
MIFNKNNNGSDELRTLTGSYYKSNEFDKIEVKIVLATEDLVKLTGEDIYLVAENHYKSSYYQNPGAVQPDAETEDSGSTGTGLPPPNYLLLDQLVQHMQLPIAFLATLWHYQGNDISHEDTGRKMKIDDTSEKMAWEWMYDRDDAAAIRNYQKTFDRLIRFLEKNIDSFPAWKNSEARKNALNLFINTIEHFNRLFAIDESPLFFLRIAPIMREIERKYIKPVIGTEKFDELKELIKSGETILKDDQELIDYICDPIPLLTMSMAVKRFSISVIPEGVVQNFFSERHSRKANLPAMLDMVNSVSKSLWNDGLFVLNELKTYWNSQNADEDGSVTDLLPKTRSTDKFISL